MISKVSASYMALDTHCDKLEKLQSEGAICGYTEELLT